MTDHTTSAEREAFKAWREKHTREGFDATDIWIAACEWQAARTSQVAAPPAPPDEPLIDGYPLWSGIPQPVSQEPPQDTFGFLDAVFNYAFEAVDLNGADIQEMGVKYGLLKEVQATEPCRDDCDCASVTDFPTQCYRTTY